MSNDSTRQRILEKAGPIFAKKGFKAATVREICEAAEVNVASINYYFGDKQNLYIETVIAARQMRVKEFPYPEWPIETPARQKLHDFVSLLLNRLVAMQTEPWQVRLLMREMMQPTEACRKLVEEYFRPFFKVMLTIVDDIAGRKLPESQRLKIGFSIIGQCLYYRFAADVTLLIIPGGKFDDEFDKQSLADHITSFSFAAIEALNSQNPENTAQNLKPDELPPVIP